MAVEYITGQAWEDSSPFLMARIVGSTNNVLAQADITSISYSVRDVDSDTPVVAGTAVTVSTVIFDTLQTDSRWTKDSTGYNFGFALPVASLPTGKKTYVVDFNITPVVGAAFPLVFLITTLERRYNLPT